MLLVESEHGSTYMEVVDGMAVISGHRQDIEAIANSPECEILHVDLSLREGIGVVAVKGADLELMPDSES
jgi:hypothetical protein